MTIKGLIRPMISDWRVKTFGQKCLGLLPGDLSLRANEVIIRWLRGGGVDRVDFISRVNKGISNIDLVHARLGVDLSDATILQVGTGWHGIDLVLFFLGGARRIYTIDRYSFLTESELTRTTERLCELVEEGGISSDGRSLLDPDRVARLEILVQRDTVSGSLFDELNIQPIVEPTEQWPCIFVPRQSVDLFYSESVLQRIPTKELNHILAASSERWLDENGVFFHRTDQKDIHSQSRADENRWALEYLKYPEWFFNTVLNGELMYQNRLRESDFIELFEQNGLQVDYVESHCGPKDVRQVRKMRLPSRFEGYDAADLATRSSRFVGHLARSRDGSLAGDG